MTATYVQQLRVLYISSEVRAMRIRFHAILFLSINLDAFESSYKAKFDFLFQYNPFILHRKYIRCVTHVPFLIRKTKVNVQTVEKGLQKCTSKLLLCGQFLYSMS